MLIFFVPSCKKAPTQDDSGETKTTDVDKEPVAAVVEKAPAADELVPIPIELPRPVFEGTPPNLGGITNLEKALGHPRPPFLAPKGTANLASGKLAVSSGDEPIIGSVDLITDGDKEAVDGSYVELGIFSQHVTIDLEEMATIYAVVVWHYHAEARAYLDVIVQVSEDPDFINYTTVYNNDLDNSSGQGVGTDMHYVETNEGKLIDAKGVKGRYVRLYTNGNNSNDFNHYSEVEVYGIPVQ
jgi:hypothetical protein